MTTKPKTCKAAPMMNIETLELAPGEASSMIYGRKVATAATGISPKLIVLAAKLDEAKANFETANDQDAAEALATAADKKTLKLERQLAKIAATNLEELKFKARYVYTDSDGCESDTGIAKSIVCDLLALGGKPVSKASWLRKTA